MLQLLLFFIPAQASDGHEHGRDDLKGPEFSDHTLIVDMPAEWNKRTIERIGWAKGADIAVTLDQQLYPALLPIIDEYAHRNNLKIAVQEGTCGIAAGNLKDKNADIGGFCCPAGETDRLPGLVYHTFAIAPVAVLVHPSNPIETIDEETLRNVYIGKFAAWRQVVPNYRGGSKSPLIRAVGRLHCKTRPGHGGRSILDKEDHFSHRMSEVSTIPDMISAVADNRDAIGYETLWMTKNFSKQGKVKTVKINGVDPRDSDRVIHGDYPFFRVFNISTWSSPSTRSDVADALLAHLMANFDRVDPDYGFIPYTRLKKAGWRFAGDELIGKPN